MEESWMNNMLLNFFSNNVEYFGKNSTYKGFEAKEDSKKQNDEPKTDGFNSLSKYGRIVYLDRRNKIQKSDPVMLKIMPSTSFQNFISFQYLNEMNFYTKIVPTLSTVHESFSSLFPKFYHGEMIFNVGFQNDKSAMILEDLTFRGFKMAEKTSFLDLDHLTLMMRKLGQFHAFSYKAKISIPELFHPLMNNIPETHCVVNGEFRKRLRCFVHRGVERLRQEPKYEKYIQRLSTMVENADDIFIKILTGDEANPFSVLCHGDYLRNNVMFRYENNIPLDLVFIDLASCRFSSPVLDLINVLYINTDQQIRNTHWDSLIDEYYTALKHTFVENQVPTKSDILAEFVNKSFSGYLIASYFLPHLVAVDFKIPLPIHLDPDISLKFQQLRIHEIPWETVIDLYLVDGGDIATQALSDILKDMIDRRFICN